MAREKLAPHRNDIIRLYRNGISAAEIGRTYNATTTTVTTLLKRAGVMASISRQEHGRRADEARIVAMFNSGSKPVDIIASTGVSKSAFYAIARRHGLALRGLLPQRMSEANKVRLALAREASGRLNRGEDAVFQLLRARGLEPITQVACGTRSIDMAIRDLSIAVEVCLRGTLNLYINSGQLSDRIRQLGYAGWHVYVFGAKDVTTIDAQAIEDISAWADFIRRAPPSRRQYRVVWSGADLLATGCCDDDDITVIRPLDYRAQLTQRYDPGRARKTK